MLLVALILTVCGNPVLRETFGHLDTLRKHAYSIQMRSLDERIKSMAMPDSYKNNNNQIENNETLSEHINDVLIPFLEPYYQNMTNVYRMMSQKMLERTTKAMNESLNFKDQIINEMHHLSDELNATDEICLEERRDSRMFAFELASRIYQCNDMAMSSVHFVHSYFQNLITVTKAQLNEIYKSYLDENSPDRCPSKEICIAKLSSIVVGLAYELEIGLMNAKSHFEDTSDDFMSCYNSEVSQARSRRIALVKMFHYCVES